MAELRSDLSCPVLPRDRHDEFVRQGLRALHKAEGAGLVDVVGKVGRDPEPGVQVYRQLGLGCWVGLEVFVQRPQAVIEQVEAKLDAMRVAAPLFGDQQPPAGVAVVDDGGEADASAWADRRVRSQRRS